MRILSVRLSVRHMRALATPLTFSGILYYSWTCGNNDSETVVEIEARMA